MRLAAVAVLLLAFAGGLLFFLLREARSPMGEAARGSEAGGAPVVAADEPAPAAEPIDGTTGAEALRQEVEDPAALPDSNAWIVRVLRGGQPAAKVDVVWATPDVHRAVIAAPDPALPDLLDRLWHAGRRTRTGAGGEASIPPPEPGSYVIARDGGAMAYHYVRPSDVPPIVLTLRRDLTLRARVVDAAGAPQEGCRITAGIRAGSDSRRTMSVTRADGLAVFSHFGVDWGIDLAHARGYLAVQGLFEPPVEVELDFEPFPDQPIELVLPAHGSVAIDLVDDSGAPVHAGHPVRLAVERPRHPGAIMGSHPADPTAEVIGGRATFPHVGLGLSVEATLDARPAYEVARVSLQGPAKPGEERLARLVLDSGSRVRFRVLDPAGSALAERDVHIALARELAGGSAWGGGHWGRTDGHGFVSTSLTGARAEGARLSVQVQLRTPDGEDLEGLLEIDRPLTPGVNELGHVLLQPKPVLVAGRVVDGRGEPIERASVRVTRLEFSETSRGRARGVATSYTDERGRFSIEAESSEGTLEMRVDAPAHLPSSTIRVAVGTRGLEIVLEQGGGLRGSLRIPVGVPSHAIQVEAPGPEGAMTRHTLPDALGEFELLGLAPGRVDVAIVLQPGAKRVASIQGIAVVGGEIRKDPRLQEIELEGLVRRLTIGVRGADGSPASGGWVRVLGPTERTGAAVGFVIENGHAEVLGEAVPLDLEINVPGHRLERLLDVESDRKVQLEPAFSVTLALAEGVDLPPASGRLQVNLVPLGDYAAPDQITLFKGGERAGFWYSAFGDESNAFGPARDLTLPVQQAGPHELSFAVVYGDPSSGGMTSLPVNASAESRELDLQPPDDGRTFRVAPDREAYAKVLARGR